SLLNYGNKDAATGIIRLPLLQALLTAGSQVPIGNTHSPFNYVILREATDPALMQPALAQPSASSAPANNLQAHFVTGGTRAGKDVGHFIPATFWNYINRADVSPDGWVQDFGTPLTEALPFTLVV